MSTAIETLPSLGPGVSSHPSEPSKVTPAVVCARAAVFLKRLVAAWVYDYIFCLWLATILVAVLKIRGFDPSQYLALPAIALLFFLFRDSAFNGRGLGKFLFGLSTRTSRGKAVIPSRSAARNLVLLAPYLLFQFAATMHCSPSLLAILKVAAMVATGIALCCEAVLMCSADGLRLADRLCKTVVRTTVESVRTWP
jgi:hypothetical protein